MLSKKCNKTYIPLIERTHARFIRRQSQISSFRVTRPTLKFRVDSSRRLGNFSEFFGVMLIFIQAQKYFSVARSVVCLHFNPPFLKCAIFEVKVQNLKVMN